MTQMSELLKDLCSVTLKQTFGSFSVTLITSIFTFKLLYVSCDVSWMRLWNITKNIGLFTLI